MSPRMLTEEQKDRAAGVLLGAAIGDALGVPYEFGPLLPEEETPEMKGGGLGAYRPGEYSDDTQMAVCIANACAAHTFGSQPRSTLDAIAANFLGWMRSRPADVGILTAGVLRSAERMPGPPSQQCEAAAAQAYERDRSAFGNGALMRTAPVGLLALRYDDAAQARLATAGAARAIAGLTHADPRAGDACVLWSEAVRVAVLDGRFELAAGLDLIPEERDPAGDDQQPPNPRAWWAGVIAEADAADWRDFRSQRNGATHKSLQVAWAGIRSTAEPGSASGRDAGEATAHVRRALEAITRVGHDTDTTAAIAGGLLGARYGAAALPDGWAAQVNGWSGLTEPTIYRAADLKALALRVADWDGPAEMVE